MKRLTRWRRKTGLKSKEEQELLAFFEARRILVMCSRRTTTKLQVSLKVTKVEVWRILRRFFEVVSKIDM